MPTKEWPQFPPINTVEHLNGRLTVELQFKPHLSRTGKFHDKWQLHFLRWPVRNYRLDAALSTRRDYGWRSIRLISTGAQFSQKRQSLDRPPCLQTASRCYVFVSNIGSRKLTLR